MPPLAGGSSGGFTPCLSFSPAGLRRWLSSAAPATRVCVVGSGPAGFYTAQHILKVPRWDLPAGEGRDLPAEGTSALPASQQVLGWICGLLALLQPGRCCWGAAWGC